MPPVFIFPLRLQDMCYKLNYAKEALKLNYTMKAIGDKIKVSDVAILDMLRRHNLVT